MDRRSFLTKAAVGGTAAAAGASIQSTAERATAARIDWSSMRIPLFA